tara:strand:- start:62 stop:1006 length:945 start_codon:yes stop_codon:yes gene_type:complete
MKEIILVTGGSGFIASHLIDKLLNLDYFVINIDKIDYCSYNNFEDIKDKYKFIYGNITNLELLRYIFKLYKIEYIFHLASQTHVDNSFCNSLQFTFDNVVGTHTLLEVCREYSSNLKKFIHMSTDEVYGGNENEEIKTETSLLMPTNPYAATKAGAEMLVNAYYKSFNIPIIIVRSNNIYGPRQYPEKVIPAFIYNTLSDTKCLVHGKGLTERHFIYVTDAVEALITIWQWGKINNIYNISAENSEIKIIDLAKLLIKKIKNEVDVEKYIKFTEDREFNDQRYYISGQKLKDIGWKPMIELNEGLNKTIEYFKN